MSKIKAVWDEQDKSILINPIDSTTTGEDFRQQMTELMQMIDAADHPVYMITILEELGRERIKQSDGNELFKDRKTLDEMVSKNLRLNVMVGAPIVMRAMSNIILKLGRMTGGKMGRDTMIEHASTIEEAHAIIAEYKAKESTISR
jgi:hypothetical protein